MNNISDTIYKKILFCVFIFSFSVVVYRAFNVSCLDNSPARNSIYGDGYSDKNTLSSAKYFYDSGFIKTAFLPVHDYYPEQLQTNAYTHYPAIPNILAGFYAVIFNSYNEFVLRIIPMLLSIAFFFFIFFVLKHVTKNNLIALIGGCSLVLADYYIAWADNLHQHLYGEFLKWIYFYLLYNYFKSGTTNKIAFIPMLIIMLLQVNISFEQPVFLGVLTLGFSIIYKKSIFTFETISAGIFVIIGFGLHILQNAIYFNSIDLAISDMKSAFMLRTAGVELTIQKAEAPFTWKNYWEVPFNWFNRMERFYFFPGWAVLILGITAMKNLKQTNNELYKIIWVLFFASISWTICMAQHAFIHSFTNKHFSIFYALLIGISLPLFINNFKIAWNDKSKKKIVFYTLLSLYMFAMFLTQQFIPVYILFGFGYHH